MVYLELPVSKKSLPISYIHQHCVLEINTKLKLILTFLFIS